MNEGFPALSDLPGVSCNLQQCPDSLIKHIPNGELHLEQPVAHSVSAGDLVQGPVQQLLPDR